MALISNTSFHIQSTISDTDRIDAAIEASTKAIERYCGRSFEEADFIELAPVGQFGTVFLRNYPVQEIKRICSSQGTVLSVSNSSQTASAARVSTTAAEFKLSLTESGTTTTTILSFASYPSLGALRTAINGISGWSCVLASAGYSGLPTADLVAGQYANAGSTNAAAQVLSWIEDVSSGLAVEPLTGILRFQGFGSWSCGDSVFAPRQVRITYTGGFEFIPEDLQQVCGRMVSRLLDNTSQMKSESLGGYSYTLDDSMRAIPIQDKDILDFYRERKI